MAHAHKLEIFRGLIKFKSNTQKIWGVLIFLTIVTAVEVVLGIYKPEILMLPSMTPFEGGFGATLLNILFSAFIYTKSLNLNIYCFNNSQGLLHHLGFYAHA